jgi:hypothetical protein
VQFIAIGDPDGTVWNAWLHPQCEQAFDIAKIPPCPETCRVCGRGGKFEYATYLGAPEGGVPVHRECLIAFFRPAMISICLSRLKTFMAAYPVTMRESRA